MEEEIDVIEILKRVKEGKAPKRIEIEGTKYKFQENCSDIVCIYQTEYYDDWLENEDITLDRKIKILDKPIIEEIEDEYASVGDNIFKDKINEIIRCLRDKEVK